ncbi:MAG TPA: 5'-nucleotidase C-terminal domain-containing protein [Syntrophorhabdaceae bacterium]|jgi:2',3'-cyclic-nucleotide 2'-phosphodiesterase (5'-nucleotidase family)
MHKLLRAFVLFLGWAMLFIPSLSHADAFSDMKQIRILYMNDFHGFAQEHKAMGSDEEVGGIAYLAARAETLRKEKPALLVAAGDMIQGNNWANLFQGQSVIKVMNEMRFDAMVVGNHEFDYGQAILRERIGEAKFPVLGANVEGIKELKPYVIKTINDVTVAIIGVVTEDTPFTTHPRNVAGLKFLSPETVVERYVRELRNKVEIIVVLSHIGINMDFSLAEKVKGIDVIVGGHTHTKLDSYLPVGKTIIVQAWEHGRVLGVLDLTVRRGEVVYAQSRLEEIKPAKMKKNTLVAATVNKYAGEISAAMKAAVGEAGVDLDGTGVRQKETNLGDMVADIIREKAGSDAAIINGGGIRTSIPRGRVSMGDVYGVLPFDNYIVAFKLTGNQVREALEHGVSGVENGEGAFPQVSGLSFTYSKTAPKGSRIKEVLINGAPLEATKIYTVATNDFLAAGGDGYKSFGEAVKSSGDYAVMGGAMKGENLIYSDSGRWIRDVVIDYVRAKKTVNPQVEGRIKELP